ncbi:MAG: hypothetical protein IT177_03470 [Acidobacteria bacterium]|nr:hypothetical protein [Acidobacteriota bacterium]
MPLLRDRACAFIVATIVALFADLTMQLALEAVRVSSYGSAPWWITANLIERGRWVLFALVLWWAAPRLAGPESNAAGAPETEAGSRAEAWRQVGVAVLVIPLLWVLATWMVSAIRFTLLGSWGTEGRVFLAPEYYRGLLTDYTPWLVAGATLLGVRSHL